MPHVTLCTSCGAMYEAGSEEQANEPSMTISGRNASRLCPRCVSDGVTEAVLRHLDFGSPLIAGYVRARMLETPADDDGEV